MHIKQKRVMLLLTKDHFSHLVHMSHYEELKSDNFFCLNWQRGDSYYVNNECLTLQTSNHKFFIAIYWNDVFLTNFARIYTPRVR